MSNVRKSLLVFASCVLFSNSAWAQVLKSENFESYQVGASWGNISATQIMNNCTDNDGSNMGKCLRVAYVPTQEGSDRLTRNITFTPGEHYVLTYDLLFEEGFEFVIGGKLPGLGPDSETVGCDAASLTGWSSRVMWLSDGRARNYFYDQERFEACGDGEVTSRAVFETDTWHRVSLNVKLNSAEDSHDGFIVLKVDDKIVSDDRNLQIRGDVSADSLISKIMFSTFFGGNTSRWAPSKTVYARFDNFLVVEPSAAIDSKGRAVGSAKPNSPTLKVGAADSNKTLYVQNFNGLSQDISTNAQWREAVPQTQWVQGFSEGRGKVVPTPDGNGQSLEVKFPGGVSDRNQSGIRWQMQTESADFTELRYRVRFPDDFEFGVGGKLPGLGGRSAVNNEDWYAIVSWRSNGELRLDVWGPSGYRQHDLQFEGNQAAIKKGEWQNLVLRVKASSDKGDDGFIEVFFGGKQVGQINRLEFVEGGKASINRLMLNSYMEQRNDGQVMHAQDHTALIDSILFYGLTQE